MVTSVIKLHELSKEIIPDGSSVAIGGVHSHNVPMSLVRQIIRLGSKNLTLIGSISTGLPIDILVGTGCVSKVLAPYVGFEMWGLAPKFRHAVENGIIEAPEVCEAFPVYSLRAASNDLLFHPFPIGIHDSSNIPQQSNLYQKVKDPFSGIETYAIQAIHPDVAILHVQKASMDGNCIHLGSVVTDRLMATASKTVIITCDELISVDEIRKNPNTTTIPSIFVDYIINLKFAAHPTSSHGMYSYDNEEIKEYLNATRSEESYNTYIDSRTSISEDEYLEKFAKHGNFTRKTFGESNEKYSIEELITCIFARDIKDGEVGICGAVSDIPMAAMQLAERNYNKQIKWIAGGSGYINPRGFLVPSSTDFQMSYSADARLSMDEVIPIEMREIDFFFAGGLQIDERGNSNLAGIPKDGGWKLRGPGSVGLPFLPKAKRVYLYTMSHNTRTLVNKVNYISGPGHIGNNQMGNGPTLLVTNKCVFKWNYNEDKWELESIHPGNSLTDIKETTGFEFEFDNITETPEPTEDELRVLRDIDKVGYLRGIRE